MDIRNYLRKNIVEIRGNKKEQILKSALFYLNHCFTFYHPLMCLEENQILQLIRFGVFEEPEH